MKVGRWILAGSIVAAAGAAGWLFFGRSDNGESAFITLPARRGPIAAVVAATGTVNPVVTVTVGSQISGQVNNLYADFNSVVKKGQIIARLETSNLEAQVARDRANVASTRAELEKARVEAANKRLAFDRAKSLRDQTLIPQSDYDTAKFDAESADASVRTAEAAVAQARASLRISEVNLDHATIRSPVDGVV